MKKVPDEILNDPDVDDNNRLFFWQAMQDPASRAKLEAEFRKRNGDGFEEAWADWLKWLCIDE